MPPTTSEPTCDKLMSDDSAVNELLESEAAYNTDLGAAFQGDSRELLQELPENSIDLIVTSPPFALQHTKEYGNEDQEGHNDRFMQFAPEVRRVLQPHGSFVIEIAGAFKQGVLDRYTSQLALLNRITTRDAGRLHFAQDL